MPGEVALCSLQMCSMSLVLILLSTTVQIKELTLQGALVFEGICQGRTFLYSEKE